MEKVKSTILNAAKLSRKYECNTVTGKGPFERAMSKKCIEINSKSRGQLNMAWKERSDA